jgi:hypothetical protein
VDDYTVTRSYDASVKNKRKFGIKIELDSKTSTKERDIYVWLSTSSNPNDQNAKLNWTMDTTSKEKRYNANGKYYTIKDRNNTVTYTCPDDLADTFLKHIGARKVYIHIRTETGNTDTVTVNLIRRVVYQQH